MIIKILVIGLTCYSDQEITEITSLLKEEYEIKKLPSSKHYLLALVSEHEVIEIIEEMEEISKTHSNPAWEIITREINNQIELENLPHVLFHESR